MCVLCVGWCVCRHGSVEGGVCMCVCVVKCASFTIFTTCSK